MFEAAIYKIIVGVEICMAVSSMPVYIARSDADSPPKRVGKILWLTCDPTMIIFLVTAVQIAHETTAGDDNFDASWTKDYTSYGLQAGYNETVQHAAGFIPLTDCIFVIIGDTVAWMGAFRNSTNTSLFLLKERTASVTSYRIKLRRRSWENIWLRPPAAAISWPVANTVCSVI